MKKFTSVIFMLLVYCFSVQAQNTVSELDVKLTKIAESKHLPGFAVAIVDKDGILFSKGYGYADIGLKKHYVKHTIQNIGSVSKTFIGVALMKAVEQGKLSLDEKINDILPFKIVNPHFPKSAITIRHLATHTSTIQDTDYYYKTYIFDNKITFNVEGIPKEFIDTVKTFNSNKKIPLKDFIKNIATPKGKWYSKRSFLIVPPGAKYSYSNLGSAIVAYIIEIKTGVAFDEYTRKNILEPLKMESSGWKRLRVDMSKHAKHYWLDMKPIPNYSLITYPDGGFRASVFDLSKYLIEVIKGYSGKGKVLSKESYREMFSRQSKIIKTTYSIFWDVRPSGLIGHTGGDPGVTTLMFFDPKLKTGTILFTNYLADDDSPKQIAAVRQIYRAIRKTSKAISGGKK